MTGSDTEPSQLRLFSGLATKPAIVGDILPDFTGATGIRVESTFEPTAVLVDAIHAGRAFDVIVGVTESLGRLADDHYVDPAIVHVARSGIGIACACGVRAPAIASVSDVVSALLGARSVAYSRSGASGIYFAGLLDRLGIREQIDARATILDKGLTAKALLDGRADMAIQQLSELRSVPGAAIVGALPDEIQSTTAFAAGIAALTADPDAARRLVRALTSADAAAAFTRTGLF